MKNTFVSTLSVAALGVCVLVVFAVLAGLDYRAQEDAGLQPGLTPDHLVVGMQIGAGLLCLGLAAFVVGAIVLLARSREPQRK